MTRIKFVTSTTRFGRDAVATLPDEQAQFHIKRGEAITQDEIPSCGNETVPAEIKKRIEFVKAAPCPIVDGLPRPPKERGLQKLPHVSGERGVFPVAEADQYIACGVAKEFAIKSLDAPQRDKMMRREAVATK